MLIVPTTKTLPYSAYKFLTIYVSAPTKAFQKTVGFKVLDVCRLSGAKRTFNSDQSW